MVKDKQEEADLTMVDLILQELNMMVKDHQEAEDKEVLKEDLNDEIIPNNN